MYVLKNTIHVHGIKLNLAKYVMYNYCSLMVVQSIKAPLYKSLELRKLSGYSVIYYTESY